jgi:hypothetical protein
MQSITAETTKILDAPAAAVYGVLADYRDGHPHILPEKYFSDLSVERGGIGAGTRIRFRIRLLGTTHTVRARIAEPDPGRVLTETDLKTGAVTTFSVQPLDAGQRSAVTIATTWPTSGMRGLIERWLAPPLLRRIYVEELTMLEGQARRHAAAALTS